MILTPEVAFECQNRALLPLNDFSFSPPHRCVLFELLLRVLCERSNLHSNTNSLIICEIFLAASSKVSSPLHVNLGPCHLI